MKKKKKRKKSGDSYGIYSIKAMETSCVSSKKYTANEN